MIFPTDKKINDISVSTLYEISRKNYLIVNKKKS